MESKGSDKCGGIQVDSLRRWPSVTAAMETGRLLSCRGLELLDHLLNRQHLREGRRADRAGSTLQVLPAKTLYIRRTCAISGEEHLKVADCGFAGGGVDANDGG